MISVAICIPTYNQGRYLETAVGSALAQTYPCEVWVADDASTDETPAVMARLLKIHPHIKYFRHENNLGIQGNPSWILRQPVTDYIVRLDSDDKLEPEYVETLLRAFQPHPEAGYAHAAVQEMDAQGQKQKLRRLARKPGFQDADESLRISVSGYRVAANICMFRRTALQQVDFYRNLSFAEDWDLAVRLADAGWGNIYSNKILSNYRAWDTPDQARSRRKLAEVEGCRRVFEESLIPAFSRRKWSLSPITSVRRQLALNHTKSLGLNGFTDHQRRDLQFALCQLGDSLALRWKFRWIRTPLATLFQLPSNLVSWARGMLKMMLFRSN